jgi:hypothetical protein
MSSDEQRRDTCEVQVLRGTCPYTSRIEPVSFVKFPCDTVIFGETPTATLNRQPNRLETVIECPPRGIDCRRIFEWRIGLSEKLLQEVWFLFQEVFDVPATLGNVTLLTGKTEIGNSVCPSLGSWIDMFYLQRPILFLTVRTMAFPLLQQIFFDFIACERSLLIFGSRDFRGL